MGVKPLLISAAFSISFLMAGAQGRWLLTNQKGVSLSYDKEFFLYCKEENSDYYKITVYFANNSGKSVLIGNALVINDIRFTAGTCWNKVLPFTNPTIQFVMEVEDNKTKPWPTGSVRRDFCYIKMPKGQLPPEPRWTMSSFTFVENQKTTQPTTPQWSPWIGDNCFQKIKYRYMGKELMNLNYQYHYYFEATNNYTETIFFVLSLKDATGNERFGTRRSIPPGKTIEFVEKMDQNYIKQMAIEKVCFKVDDSKYLPCDDERGETIVSDLGLWKSEYMNTADTNGNDIYQKVKIQLTVDGLIFTSNNIPLKFKKIAINEYEWTRDTKQHLKLINKKTFQLFSGKEPSIKYFKSPPSSVSDNSIYPEEITHPLIKGIYIMRGGTEKVMIEPTDDGFYLTKEGEKTSSYYMYEPYSHYKFFSPEKGKSMSLLFSVKSIFILSADDVADGGKSYVRFVSEPEKKKKPIEVVKQENKPAPVTENKTVSSNSAICGKWSTADKNAPSYGSYIIEVTCTGDKLSIRYEKDLSKYYQGTLATGTITTAQKTSDYKNVDTWRGKTEITYHPSWSGICPFKTENEQANLPGTWIYFQDEDGVALILKVGNYKINFYKVK